MWFWYRNGSHLEARDLALKALATPSANQNGRSRARTLNTAGFFLCLLGDTRSARRVLEEARALLQQSADKLDLAWSLQHLGLVLSYEKEYDLADKAFQEGLEISKEFSPPNSNTFLFFYGDVDLQRGDRDRAKQKYEESAEAFRAIGNEGFLAYPLRRLGYLALEQNDFPSAHKYFLESLNLNHRTGDIPGTTASLVSLAALALEVERPTLAVQFYSAAESRFESVSVNLLFLDQVELGRIRADIRTRLSEPDFSTAFAEGWKMSDEQALRLAEEISQKAY
jgi:tetratricopeptide (TPR) repeat protein